MDKRPFHETIVDALKEAETIGETILLAKMIRETKIPKNHEVILAAWNDLSNRLAPAMHGEFFRQIPVLLLEGKRDAEASAQPATV